MAPWGNGTKQGKGGVPSRLDLVVRTERLNRILDMNTANLTVTAQAGVRFQEIQAALAGEENRCYLPLEDAVTPSDRRLCSERPNTGCFIPFQQCHGYLLGFFAGGGDEEDNVSRFFHFFIFLDNR